MTHNPYSSLDFQATKSTLGGGGEVLLSSHKLHLAEPPVSWTSSCNMLGCLSNYPLWVKTGTGLHLVETKSPSNTCSSWNKIYTYRKFKDTQLETASLIGWAFRIAAKFNNEI